MWFSLSWVDDPPGMKLRMDGDGLRERGLRRPAGEGHRAERSDDDPRTALHASDSPLERTFHVGRREVEDACNVTRTRPRPADLRQATRRLDGQLDLDRDGQAAG